MRDETYESLQADGTTENWRVYPEGDYGWLESPPLVPNSVGYDNIRDETGRVITTPVWTENELMRIGRELYPGRSDSAVRALLRKARHVEHYPDSGNTRNVRTYPDSLYPFLEGTTGGSPPPEGATPGPIETAPVPGGGIPGLRR